MVRDLVAEGRIKEALRICKDFRIGTTKEQRDAMARGYECFIRPEFYASIGKDTEACKRMGEEEMRRVLGL